MEHDKELLRRAAKAAGIEVWPGRGHQADMLFARPAKPDPDGRVTGVEWNPLNDDGDALRLAVKLGLVLSPSKASIMAWLPGDVPRGEVWEALGADPYVATRRAIVRAAAALGGDGHED
jgi:hypothetical protein